VKIFLEVFDKNREEKNLPRTTRTGANGEGWNFKIYHERHE